MLLFFRALLAFVALPVVVAGLVPWMLLSFDSARSQGSVCGWPVFLAGVAALLWTVRDFLVIGKGTLAPWEPPRKLLVTGLYGFTRNPMSIGVLGIVLGLGLLAGSRLLAVYATLLALLFHGRVVFYEEPVLVRDFPEDWIRYRGTVNRWLPRRGKHDAAQ